ncbi:hypothetical protein D3C84_1180390 [compost metagenome]
MRQIDHLPLLYVLGLVPANVNLVPRPVVHFDQHGFATGVTGPGVIVQFGVAVQ